MKRFIPVLVGVLSLGAIPGAAIGAVSQSSIPSLPPAAPMLLGQAVNVEAIARSFVEELAAQRFAEAVENYSDTSQQTVTAQTLQQNWTDITRESGRFVQIAGTQRVADRGDAGEVAVIVTCQFLRGNRDLFVVLRGEDVIEFSPVE